MQQALQARFKPLAAAALALALLVPGEAAATAKLHGQGVLWRVEGFGYQPSHVFGTMHVTDERILALPEPVLNAFDNARACLFEILLEGNGFVGIPEQMLLPQGIRLEQILGPRTYGNVVAAARRYGFSTRQIGRMHPYALMFVFDQTPSEWRRQSAGWTVLDHALQNEARSLNKPIYPLERVAEQMALLDRGGEQVQIGVLLEAMIERSRQQELDIEVMMQDYLRRDLDALFAREASYVSRQPTDVQREMMEYNVRLLDVRNHIMVSRMQPHLAQGGAFVAVGAMHLPGKDGVLHLLERMGYTVTRVY